MPLLRRHVGTPLLYLSAFPLILLPRLSLLLLLLELYSRTLKLNSEVKSWSLTFLVSTPIGRVPFR